MAESILGKDIITNKDITIDQKARTRGVYIIAKTGSGKSVLIQNMALQDIEAGLGVCVLDPHGDLIKNILANVPPERKDDVILLNPMDADHPFGLNLYECADPTSPTAVQDTISGLMQIYEKVFEIGRDNPLIEQVLRATAYTLIDNGMTMTEIPMLLLDEAFRKRLTKNVTNPQVQWFWRMYESLSLSDKMTWAGTAFRKVDEFVSSPIVRYIVGQAKTTLNFREIMDKGKILLVELPGEQHRDVSSLIGAVIINQLLLATLSRKHMPEKQRKYFCLYADEFQQFAIQSFGTLLVEARKYHVCTTLANQVLGDIEEAILRKVFNAGTLVVLRVTSEDAEKLAGEFDLTPPASDRSYTIPSDVLYHLTDHPSPRVKQFEQQFVRRLLEAKALSIRTKTERYPHPGPGMGIYEVEEEVEVFPRYNFRPVFDKEVSFDPADLRYVLREIENFFYDCMTQEEFDFTKRIKPIMPSMAEFLGVTAVYYHDWKLPTNDEELEIYSKEFEERQQGGIKDDLLLLWMFYIGMMTTYFALKRDPIRVRPSHMPDDPPQQTFADRRNQIANELVHLDIGQAMIKLPDGEYRMKTMLPNELEDRKYAGKPLDDAEKKRIAQFRHEERLRRMRENRPRAVANTIREYCKSRAEVEEEIRQRQEDDGPTKRRGGYTA